MHSTKRTLFVLDPKRMPPAIPTGELQKARNYSKAVPFLCAQFFTDLSKFPRSFSGFGLDSVSREGKFNFANCQRLPCGGFTRAFIGFSDKHTKVSARHLSAFDKVDCEDHERYIWWRHFLSGGIAGLCSRTITAPLDRAKLYSQVHKHSQSLLSILRFLAYQNGTASLWRGNYVNVLKIMPESAIKFTSYEEVKRLFRKDGLHDLQIHERFIAGSIAGGIAQSVVYPLEVIKVRLALNLAYPAESLRSMARKMFQNEGIHSFFRGYIPNIIGCIPYGGIELTIYESLKRFYTSYLPLGDEPGFLGLMACSSISTAVGQCSIYPMTLLRTRQQIGGAENKSFIKMFRTVVQNEGYRGLYQGFRFNLFKVVPACSINFVMYEYASRWLGVRMT